MARATFYYHTKRLSEPDGYDDARTAIHEIYDHHKGRYGYRRITSQLRNDGILLWTYEVRVAIFAGVG